MNVLIMLSIYQNTMGKFDKNKLRRKRKRKRKRGRKRGGLKQKMMEANKPHY